MKTPIKIPKILFLMLAISLVAVSCDSNSSYRDGTMAIAGKTINIETAITPTEQSLGLGGRPSIGDSEGMLFFFDPPQITSFWMKDMKFDIDIVWIRNGKVVDITANAVAQPEARLDSEFQLYGPKTEVDQVLEVQSNWVVRHSLKLGDTVVYHPN